MTLVDKGEKLETMNALIVRSLPEGIFTDDNVKKDLKNLFSSFGEAFFTFLPGFRRVIVKYVDPKCAHNAKTALHEKECENCILKVFFKEEAKQVGEPFLKLPQAEKLFLISPPASPPVGWEQIIEDAPVVNYELLSAISQLEIPGKPVELVSKTNNTPGIIVVGCEDIDFGPKQMKSMNAMPREELQTKRPPIN